MEIKKNSPDNINGKSDYNLFKRQANIFLLNYFNYLIFAVSLIIFVLGSTFFIYPRAKRIIASDQAERRNLQNQYDGQNGYLTKIINLKQSYRQISEADKKKIESMVPADKRVIGLIPEIESIVLKNGAFLNSIKIDSPDLKSRPGTSIEEKRGPAAGIFGPLPEGIGLVKIEVDLGSVNYQVLKNIIKTLENNLRLLDVAKISYPAQESKVNLIIYAYYLN